MDIYKYYSDDERVWTVSDFRSGSVSLTKDQLEGHIAIEHPEMVSKMEAIKDTVQDPDDVYYDISEQAEPHALAYYKETPLLGTTDFRVKVAVAYTDGTYTEGFVKTSHKVDKRKRKAESDDLRLYHKEK